MSSLKMLLCELSLVMLFGAHLILGTDKDNETATPNGSPPDDIQFISRGNCSCGGFPTTSIEAGATPMLSQTPGLVVTCNEEGEAICKNLCNALATAAKAKGPEVLCNRLKTANELRLSAFFKVCDKPWTYANITAEEPLCCEESKVLTCPAVQTLATDTVVTSQHPM